MIGGLIVVGRHVYLDKKSRCWNRGEEAIGLLLDLSFQEQFPQALVIQTKFRYWNRDGEEAIGLLLDPFKSNFLKL